MVPAAGRGFRSGPPKQHSPSHWNQSSLDSNCWYPMRCFLPRETIAESNSARYTITMRNARKFPGEGNSRRPRQAVGRVAVKAMTGGLAMNWANSGLPRALGSSLRIGQRRSGKPARRNASSHVGGG